MSALQQQLIQANIDKQNEINQKINEINAKIAEGNQKVAEKQLEVDAANQKNSRIESTSILITR